MLWYSFSNHGDVTREERVGLTHMCCVHGMRNKRHLLQIARWPTDNAFLYVTQVKTRLYLQLLPRRQTLKHRGVTLRGAVLQLPMVTTQYEATATTQDQCSVIHLCSIHISDYEMPQTEQILNS